MCRNIKTLFNFRRKELAHFDPPATDQEVREASLQFVRKLSSFTKPSLVNEEAFNQAVEKISSDAKLLLNSLSTNTEAKNREVEAKKAKEKAAE